MTRILLVIVALGLGTSAFAQESGGEDSQPKPVSVNEARVRSMEQTIVRLEHELAVLKAQKPQQSDQDRLETLVKDAVESGRAACKAAGGKLDSVEVISGQAPSVSRRCKF